MFININYTFYCERGSVVLQADVFIVGIVFSEKYRGKQSSYEIITR